MTDQQMDDRLRAAGERWRAADGADTSTVELPPAHDEPPAQRARRRRPWLLAAAAAAVVALVAGGALALRGTRHNAPSAELAGLVGNVWLLNTPQSNASFYIDRQGKLVVDDECQVSGGTATVSGNRLTVSDLVTRYKSCIDPGFSPSSVFSAAGLRIVRGPATFSIDQHGLTISRKGVGELHLVPPTTPIPPPSLDVPTLTDTNWVRVDQTGPRVDMLRILDDGTIASPCTSGRAALNGALRISGCPGYNGTWAWSVSGNLLRLKHGSSANVFAWRPSDPSVIDPAQLTGRTWHLESVAGVAPSAPATFRIDRNSVTYGDECRMHSGKVHVQQGTFAIAPQAAGRTCRGRSQAETINSFLTTSPASWAVRHGKLIVYGGGAQAFALVYGKGSPASADLSGTWHLTKIIDRSRHQLAVTAPAQLVIDAKNVSGTDGCRAFHGTVATRNDTAAFSVTMPEPACSSSIEKTAGLVDQLLGGRVTYRVGPTSLVLTRAGAGEFTFTKSTTGDGDPAALLHKTWQLDRITFGDDIYRTGAPTADNGTLTFTEHGYTVDHTCYTVQGTAQRDSGTIQFTGGRTTSQHSCPAPSNRRARAEASQAIDAVLGPQTRWTLDGSTLTIESNDGTLLFHDSASLTTTNWQVIATLSGSIRTSVIDGEILRFPNDHTLSIAGCNTSQAAVDIVSGTMSITGLHLTTTFPCPSTTAETAPAGVFVGHLLDGVVTWSIAGDQLTIAKGGDAAVFYRADATSTSVAELRATRTWTLDTVQTSFNLNGTSVHYAKPLHLYTAGRRILVEAGDCGPILESTHLGEGQLRFAASMSHAPTCRQHVVPKSEHDEVDAILVGNVTWVITGPTLTITNGVGAVTFTRRP